MREPLHSLKCFVIYIYFILCAPCPLVTIPADNTWHACGTVPWHVGPTLLFVLQNIQNGRFWLLAVVRTWCSVYRRVHPYIFLMFGPHGGPMSLMFIGTSSDCCASCALSVAMGVLMSEPSACVVGLVLPSSSLSTVSNPSVCVISIGCVFVGFFILFSIVCRSRNFWRIEWWLFLFGRVTI